MRIGVAKEIKAREYRVALTPAGALELVQRGHEVLIEETFPRLLMFPFEPALAQAAPPVAYIK